MIEFMINFVVFMMLLLVALCLCALLAMFVAGLWNTFIGKDGWDIFRD